MFLIMPVVPTPITSPRNDCSGKLKTDTLIQRNGVIIFIKGVHYEYEKKRTFTEEFRCDAVSFIQREGYSLKDAASRLGIPDRRPHESVLGKFVLQRLSAVCTANAYFSNFSWWIVKN